VAVTGAQEPGLVKAVPIKDRATLRTPAQEGFTKGSTAAARGLIWPFLLFVAVVGITAADVFLGMREARERAADQAATVVRLVEEHTARSLEGVELLLARVVEAWTRADSALPPEGDALNAGLRQMLPTMPHVTSIALVSATGRPLADSAVTDDGWLLADGEYVAAHRDWGVTGLHVSAPSNTIVTRRPFIAVSRPWFAADGSLAGIAVAYVEPEYFVGIYRSLSVGAKGTLSLFRRDGVLLARNDPGLARIGQRFDVADRRTEEVGLARDPVDQVERLLALRQVAGRELLVLVGLDEDDYMAEWQRRARTELVIAVAFATLILAYAAVSRRQLRQREEMAREIMRAKEEADAASLSKTRFLTQMSHELRTPLNSILGFAELIEVDDRDDLALLKRHREYAHDIRMSGEHLLQLINDLLDLAKIEADQKKLHPEPMTLQEEVRRCVDMVVANAHRARVELDLVLPEDPIRLVADRRAVRQIVLNLLSNALKFTLAGGRVTVSAVATGEHARLVVGDTGIGIPRHQLERLGRPFETLEDPFQRKPSGTGLGLALSTSLARLHGGQLEIESQEGEGTTVTVTLPLNPTAG
jgi:signal transduction histidine kinase